jgi:uncharacterized OB-fold protein
VRTADFAGSLRCGTGALLAALDAVKAGSARKILVAASDMRLSEPKHYMETMMGDSAAALLVGEGDVILEFQGAVTIAAEFTDVWRKRNDTFLNYDDEKYSSTHGYLKFVPRALGKLLENQGLKPDDLGHIVAYAPEGASYMALARRSGFPHIWNMEPLLMGVGNAGSASPLLQLCHVLEGAKPGERIALIGYGDGADALLFQVTDAISGLEKRRRLSKFLASKAYIDSYAKTLQYRGIFRSNRKGIWDFSPYSSIALMKNQESQLLPLYGKKCTCGTVIFPMKRICPKCQAVDQGDTVKLRHRGKIFSYIGDHVFPNPEGPVVMAVIDLEDGGRLLTQMIDCAVESLDIDMPVELTFRKYHEGKGFYNYFWKARPERV